MSNVLTQIQTEPHPVFEAADDTQIQVITAELMREDLPEDMSLSFRGHLIRFRTVVERIQFVFGMDVAFDILYVVPGTI